MTDLAYLHQVFPISPATRTLCERVGAERLAYHKTQPWYRNWNAQSYVVGCFGEALVAHLTQIPWVQGWGGDGIAGDDGEDFPDTDVKSIPVEYAADEGWLRRLADSKKWAPFYCLVVVQSDWTAARYCGWTTGTRLAKSPTKEFGHGPTCVLHERSLNPGLPPPLTKGRVA